MAKDIECSLTNNTLGIIIFPHIDNTQYAGTINFEKKNIKKETQKKWGHPISWLVIGDGNNISLQWC